MSEQLPRLLPLEAYPPHLTVTQLDYVDNSLRDLAFTIPDEPGTYLDRSGDPFIRDDEGGWTDKEGVRHDAAWTPALAGFAPWTKVEPVDG